MLPTLFYYTQLRFPGRAQFLVIQGRVRGKPTHRQFVFLESMHVYKWGQLRDRVNLCWGNNGKTTPLKSFVTYVSQGAKSQTHESKQG